MKEHHARRKRSAYRVRQTCQISHKEQWYATRGKVCEKERERERESARERERERKREREGNDEQRQRMNPSRKVCRLVLSLTAQISVEHAATH
jgi:hypothetical protein